jgi:hypothetical protein
MRLALQGFPKAQTTVFRFNETMTAHRKQRNINGHDRFATASGDAASIGTMNDCSLTERIERALLLLAYLIELDGDVHVPMYEKFESELAELKAVADVKARASQRLEIYRQSGERKAICSKNLSFNSNDGPLPYLGL